MDIEESQNQLTIVSDDNVIHKIEYQLFCQFSQFAKDIISDQNLSDPIQCALSSSQIELALQFVRDRKNNYKYKPLPKPLLSGNISLQMQDIDFQFISSIKSEKDLYGLLKASHFFRIDILDELIYAYIAAQFIDKTNPELREKYGIQEQITESIDKEIKEKYADLLIGTPFEE